MILVLGKSKVRNKYIKMQLKKKADSNKRKRIATKVK
jgi:hypothetical protein